MESLTSSDRCDSCQAQGYVVVVRKGHSDFIFCGHHYANLATALETAGWTISVDTRELLTRRPVGTEVS
jgi:hypothetical protein